ncbi:hypothetical protein A6F68_02236 [Tsuneonella dongtanensis]|uniref:Uncharacterized protein n=1 Tax=Tsuneonella dongtanensis TaxID=692370 RepID=A0A1B2AF39_9SPHN|nr:hypothetical protein [Tsuneonella dongtanensis]ANY20736.1 hypothetical protein A6F68_02236 [Tsuneonella dongtanensis]
MNRLLIFSAALMLAGPALAQSSNENDRDDIAARNDVSVEKTLERAEHDRMDARANDRVSRVALEQWAGCIARSHAGEATRVLTIDFKAPAYGRAMQMLSQESKDCIRFRGTLRAGGLLFAGEMAEALLEQPGEAPVARLARAAAGPATPSFSFTDKVAICTVRSAPNDVADLFATARDSAEENAALQKVSAIMGLCAKAAEASKPLSINPAGLRAMLATAAFRSVESSKSS